MKRVVATLYFYLDSESKGKISFEDLLLKMVIHID